MKTMKLTVAAAAVVLTWAGAMFSAAPTPSDEERWSYATRENLMHFLAYRADHTQRLAQLPCGVPLTIFNKAYWGMPAFNVAIHAEQSISIVQSKKCIPPYDGPMWCINNRTDVTPIFNLRTTEDRDAYLKLIWESLQAHFGSLRDAYTEVTVTQEMIEADGGIRIPTFGYIVTMTTTISAAELEKFAPELYALAASQAQAEAAQTSAQVPATN